MLQRDREASAETDRWIERERRKAKVVDSNPKVPTQVRQKIKLFVREEKTEEFPEDIL